MTTEEEHATAALQKAHPSYFSGLTRYPPHPPPSTVLPLPHAQSSPQRIPPETPMPRVTLALVLPQYLWYHLELLPETRALLFRTQEFNSALPLWWYLWREPDMYVTLGSSTAHLHVSKAGMSEHLLFLCVIG